MPYGQIPPYGSPYAAPAGYYGTMPPPRRRPWWFYVAVIAGSMAGVTLLVMAMVWSAARALGDGGNAGGFRFDGDRIAVIDVTGVILSPETVSSQLRRFGDDASVVGSIGVIMEWTNYGDLMRWAKLKNVTIHAGELKDAGDPSRDLTPKEEAYFQSLVDNMYGQFVHDVAEGRHTTDDKIRPLATGQVWTGQQALPLGLIDKSGGYRVALMDTAKAVGIRGEPNVVRTPKPKKGLFAALTGDADDLFPNPSQLLNRAPGFYFLWK